MRAVMCGVVLVVAACGLGFAVFMDRWGYGLLRCRRLSSRDEALAPFVNLP